MIFNGVLGVLIGFFLLLFGRRFFWLAAGLIAFLFGWQVISNVIGGGWLTFFLALGFGAGLTWLAVRFIRLVAYLLAFLGGAFVFTYVNGYLGLEVNRYLLILLGGILGVAILWAAFDWVLILVTAWAGTTTIMISVHEWITLEGVVLNVVLWLLLLFGVVWQGGEKLRFSSVHRAFG